MESYLLGLTDQEQTREIDALLKQSGELRDYLDDLEAFQYKLTESMAVVPPESTRQSIKTAISELQDQGDKEELVKPVEAAKSIPWILMASLFGLVLFFITSIQLFTSKLQLQRELIQNQLLLEQHQKQAQETYEYMDMLQEQLLLLNDPSTREVELNGNRLASDLKIVAFWNEERGQSMLSVRNLPDLADNQCFQMWADVDGEMKSLGVIEQTAGIEFLDYLADAESLNITIEKEGGSDHPDVSRLVASAIL